MFPPSPRWSSSVKIFTHTAFLHRAPTPAYI